MALVCDICKSKDLVKEQSVWVETKDEVLDLCANCRGVLKFEGAAYVRILKEGDKYFFDKEVGKVLLEREELLSLLKCKWAFFNMFAKINEDVREISMRDRLFQKELAKAEHKAKEELNKEWEERIYI